MIAELEPGIRDIELLGNGVRVGDEHIDTLAHGAAQRLRELCGPIVSSHVFPEVPVFAAAIEFGAERVVGSELESSLLRIPGVSGIAGLLSLHKGELNIGFGSRGAQAAPSTNGTED